MHIKRFTGPSVKDALRQVKAEFGGNALILSTKKLSQVLHEVVAAIDHDLVEEAVISLDAPVSASAPTSSFGSKCGDNGKASGLDAVKSEITDLKDLCLKMLS